MRMMMTVQMEVEASNAGIASGEFGPALESTMERLQPEAAYFVAVDGRRTAIIVFDMKDPAQIPVVCEPWFQTANAKIDLTPAMDREDLAAGVRAWQDSR